MKKVMLGIGLVGACATAGFVVGVGFILWSLEDEDPGRYQREPKGLLHSTKRLKPTVGMSSN